MPQPDPTMGDPVIIVHGYAHAVAALKAAAAAGQQVVLASAPGAGGYAGAGWFRALAEAAGAAVPEARFSVLLDCDAEAGPVLAALRAGIGGIVFTGRSDVAYRLAAIARRRGARLVTARPEDALDLGSDFFATEPRLVALCAVFLARAGSSAPSGGHVV
jgi:hypothetical protein